jgi:surfactin synthase thioesterase subunit
MNEWLQFFPTRRTRPQVLLVCIPPAGGGASGFAPWVSLLPQWVDLCAVALPGREARIGEPFADSVSAIAKPAAAATPVVEAATPAVAAPAQKGGKKAAAKTTRRSRAKKTSSKSEGGAEGAE